MENFCILTTFKNYIFYNSNNIWVQIMIFDLFLDKGNKKGGNGNASNGATTTAPAAARTPQAPPGRQMRQQRSES